MIDEQRYVPFLIKHNITQAQYLLMHLLYKKRYDLIKQYKDKFPTDDNTMIGLTPIKQLIEDGFIKQIGKGGTADTYKLTNKFLCIFVDDYIAGNEFWDLYPAYVESKGIQYPLTLMDKNEFRELYAITINYSADEHREVMQDLKFAVENNLVKGKIDIAVKSEIWLAWRKLRQTHFNINIHEEHDF